MQGSILVPSLLRCFAAEIEAHLAAPAAAPGPWLIPKIVDFDEASRTFSYDTYAPRKRPNWTYEDAPPEPAAPRPIKPAKPAEPRAPLRTKTVHLAPDVREGLARVVVDEAEVDAVVNEALRAWLRDRGA